MKIKCSACQNKNCIIKLCSSDSKSLIESLKTASYLKKNQYLFREGNLVEGIYILYSGKLKVFTTGYNDKVQTIRLAKEGYLIGHRGIGDQYYTISAATIENSIVCFIDKKNFHEILKQDINLTYNMMLFYANELRSAESRMKTLSQMTVREKAIEALLLAGKIFGKKKNKTILIDATLSREDYSEIAGMNKEQFTRILFELKSDKLIKTDKKHITLMKVDALENLISSYYPPSHKMQQVPISKQFKSF